MRRGFDVSVICDRIGSDSRIDSAAEPMKTMLANTHRWWPVPAGLGRAVRLLPAKLEDKVSTAADMLWTGELNRCDLLLAHFGGNGLRLARAKKRGRLAPPIVTIFHGNDVGIPAHDGTLDRYLPLFRHGTQQLTVNEVFRTALIAAGAPERQVAVHRMGIDCDDIAYRPRDLGQGAASTDLRLPSRREEGHCLRAARRRCTSGGETRDRLALHHHRRRTFARRAACPRRRARHRRQGRICRRDAACRRQAPALAQPRLPAAERDGGRRRRGRRSGGADGGHGRRTAGGQHISFRDPGTRPERPDRVSRRREKRRPACRTPDLDRRESRRGPAHHRWLPAST